MRRGFVGQTLQPVPIDHSGSIFLVKAWPCCIQRDGWLASATHPRRTAGVLHSQSPFNYTVAEAVTTDITAAKYVTKMMSSIIVSHMFPQREMRRGSEGQTEGREQIDRVRAF
jgi:hypothetical protein